MRKLYRSLLLIFPLLLILAHGQDVAAQGSLPAYDPLFDVNSDCVINEADIILVAADWLIQPLPNPAHDVNDDGYVNIVDIQLVAAHWGASCSPQPQGFVVDHNAIALFDDIPLQYIQAASNMTMLFRHASVGNYISSGLDSLWNSDPIYNRSQWVFEFHQPPPANPNPGWWNKVTLFVDRVDNLGPDEQFEVVGFKFGDVDQNPNHDISVLFFDTDPGNAHANLSDLEELEARHPDKLLMWWSQALNQHAQPIAASFNEQMRQYTADHEKVLMDIADIESHHPDGTPCFDLEGGATPAICSEYTFDGNHPNAWGVQRLSKAVWVFMARLAGWDGISP